jgi:lipid-A-disaccharide synthase
LKRVLIVAGDPSGDLVASQLVESMKKIDPALHVVGIGGENLKRVSNTFLANIVGQHALGFAISPQKIFYFRNILNTVIEPEIKNNPPDAVIPVDFYGFNSRVAALAKKYGRKVFYYVSPQFWASRPGRAERLRSAVDMFLCLFPFEAEFYRKRQLPAHFVGHPILDRIPDIDVNDRGPQRIEPIIGLLPGSRPEEIKRHLPVMAGACEIIKKNIPGSRFVLFTVPNVDKDLYKNILSRPNSQILVEMVRDENYAWRSQLDASFTASGMETLENALLGIPMVIMYKTDWITYAVARSLINIRFLGMPNLLADKSIVPEFIQWKATSDSVARPMLEWLKNPAVRTAKRAELLALREIMGAHGASERAARLILEEVA